MAVQTPVDKATARCSLHEITYKRHRNQAKPMYAALTGASNDDGCPMCEAGRIILGLEAEHSKLLNELSRAADENRQLLVQMDVFEAMKSALELTEGTDLAMVKAMCYRHRDDVHVAIQPLMDAKKKACGFRLIDRSNQDIIDHRCSTVGGAMLATCYAEACRAMGNVRAVLLLVKAVAWRMAIPAQE